MPITINGTGTITGISAGGLPDACIVADDLASNAVTTAKVADANITTAKIADANITAAKLSGAQSGSAPIYGCRAWVAADDYIGEGGCVQRLWRNGDKGRQAAATMHNLRRDRRGNQPR